MALNVGRSVRLPRHPTKALGGPQVDTTSKLLLEEQPSLPDYPSLLLLEDHHSFLLEG
jgi:hypothetical protein